MRKRESSEVEVWAGIDVSARELTVAVERAGEEEAGLEFANTASGHKQLLMHLVGRSRRRARVCLEASGNYSLDLCLALAADRRVELSVINPRQARRFAESLGKRSKTDPVDAGVLLEHARRMPCVPWQAPSEAALKLRTITRSLAALSKIATQEKNRMHALQASQALPQVVVQTLRQHQKHLEQCRRKLEQEARRVIAGDAELSRRLQLLDSVSGIGERAGLSILGELAVLPAVLDARQWVAHSGLDPRQEESGSSVHKKPHISKLGNRRLRQALYMPALVAVGCDPHLRGFYQRLQAKGKSKLQALTAVMRKLLHAVHAMFRRNEVFDGAKLCPQLGV